jgi:hypothetical protein
MMEDRSPPPYSRADEASSSTTCNPHDAQRNALLNHLTAQVNKYHSLDRDYPAKARAILDRETERLRNMLEFTLSLDYHRNTTASLSAGDREHFTHMAEALRQLRTTVCGAQGRPAPEVRPTPEERQVLAAYFLKYLGEPCKALSLPTDCVLIRILGLSLYTTSCGEYKGAVFGVLQTGGVDVLAAKLYMDREVVIPRVFADYAVQHQMVQAIYQIQEMYFSSIEGLEGSTLPDSDPGVGGWNRVQNYRYELNERGRTYEFNRTTAIARASKDMSTNYWMKVVRECVDSVTARFNLVKQKKKKADIPFPSWRGEAISLPASTTYEPYTVPSGWRRLLTFHMPDYLEFRDQVDTNDC